MCRWRAVVGLLVVPLLSGCVTTSLVMPRPSTAEYNYGGSGLWDSYRDMSLRVRYGYFFTKNFQLGGSASYSRLQFNSDDDALNRYRIGGEANYLIPLSSSPTALYIGALGSYSKTTDQDGVFSYGAQGGAKFFVRPDWNLDLGLSAKWSDEELQDDEPVVKLGATFNPIIGGGLRTDLRQGTQPIFSSNVWLLDGRASWEFNPDTRITLRSDVGYFATERFLLGGSVSYDRVDPDNGDAVSDTRLGARLDYLFGSARLWRPYVGADVNYYDATEQESVLGYGAHVGVRWWSTTNVTPFAEFGVETFSEDDVSAEWRLKIGISQALRPLN